MNWWSRRWPIWDGLWVGICATAWATGSPELFGGEWAFLTGWWALGCIWSIRQRVDGRWNR